jgi:hypothetical protein
LYKVYTNGFERAHVGARDVENAKGLNVLALLLYPIPLFVFHQTKSFVYAAEIFKEKYFYSL